MPTKKGRKKYIESAEKLWEYFERYKKSVKDNPFKVHDFVGKGAKEVHRNVEKPLTFIGFENWLFEHKIIDNLTDYRTNRDGKYSDYSNIIARINEHIRDDQISGGMSGLYNSNLTARLNGLSDKREHEIKGEQPLFGKKDKTDAKDD